MSNTKHTALDTLIYTALGVVLFGGYFLFFAGSWFSYPIDEDMWLSASARDIGFAPTLLNLFSIYDGRYSTNILHVLNPLTFNWIQGYSMMSSLIILLLVHSFYTLLTSFFTYRKKYHALLLSLGTIFIFFTLVPVLNNNLYWVGSAYVYLFPLIFYFYWLGQIVAMLQCSTAPSNLKYIVATITLVIAIGFNETFLALYAISLSSLFIYSSIYRKETTTWILPHILTGLVGIVFFVTAPGAQMRVEQNTTPLTWHLLLQIGKHFLYVLQVAVASPQVIISIAIMAALHKKWSIRTKVAFTLKHKVVIALFSLLSVLGMIAVYNYAKNIIGDFPIRIFGPLIGLVFAMCVLLFVSQFYALFNHKYYMLFTSIVLLVALSQNKNLQLFSKDFLSGDMQRFKTFMMQRTAVLEEASRNQTEAVKLPHLESYPNSIYYYPDPETQQNNSVWNRYYESYFHVGLITTYADTSNRMLLNKYCDD
ncbi:MAG: hypothetical protein KF872_06990 [Chitinophagales bacterium]|nr:hypothetical protein [Chitinophagales bacterium]